MMPKIAIFCAVLACAYAGQLDFTDCPNADLGTGTISYLGSPNFTDYADVVLVRGQIYTFEMDFVAGVNSASLRPSVFGIIAGIPAPWNGVNDPACPDLVGVNKCPLVAGQAYQYSTSIEVLNSYPAVSLTFQWALTAAGATGTKGENQICFRMPARIV